MYSIDELRAIIKDELDKKEYIQEPHSLFEPILYILEDGGKRLRPLLTLMAYNLYREDIEKVLKSAIGIEIFHNYTLLHDDVMDDAELRRGRLTVHKKWNSNVAILSGRRGGDHGLPVHRALRGQVFGAGRLISLTKWRWTCAGGNSTICCSRPGMMSRRRNTSR